MSERAPTQAEVQQDEPESYTPAEVPVRIEGPVRAQVLPATSWAARHFETNSTDAVKIANRDPRRTRLTIQTFSANHWIGEGQQRAKANVGFLVPGGGYREFYHTEEVWAICGSGTDAISVTQEYWTK